MTGPRRHFPPLRKAATTRLLFLLSAVVLGALGLRSWSGSTGPVPGYAKESGRPGPAGKHGLAAAVSSRTTPPVAWISSWTALAAETDSGRRERLVIAWLRAVKPGERILALEWLLRASPSELGAGTGARLIREWTRDDPQAAATWTQANATGPERAAWLQQVALVWANLSLGQASAWAQLLPAIADRPAVVEAVAGEAVRTDTVAALHLALTLPESPGRDAVMTRAATEWAVTEPAAASEWVHGLPPGNARDQALAGLALVLGKRRDTQQAVHAAMELPDGRLRADTLVGIAQRWAQSRPAAAAEWVDTLPLSETKFAAIENVALTWSAADPEAAAAWLDRLSSPSDPLKP